MVSSSLVCVVASCSRCPYRHPLERLDMQQEHADHREVGRKLDLFHQRPQAPGMVFWHAAGFELFERLVAAARDVLPGGSHLNPEQFRSHSPSIC